MGAILIRSLGCSPETESPAPAIGVEDETWQRLEALGYADWGPPEPADRIATTGVTRSDPARSAPGLNLYNSQPRSRAQLVDGTGRSVHTWTSPGLADVGWHHVELTPDGGLLAIVKHAYLERLDRNSKRLWRLPIRAHHDLAIAPDGSFFVLTKVVRRIELHGRVFPIIDTEIAQVSAEGDVLRRVPLSPAFAQLIPPARVEKLVALGAARPDGRDPSGTALDVFHTNTLERLERGLPGLARAGDFLVSLRNLDLIALIRLDPLQVLWSFGPGTLEHQHQPTLLDSGNILVFDNGSRRGWSRVVEVDPREGEIVWEWAATPRPLFYSRTRGGVQPLANGNVLVTESDRGRVFELTRSGEIVWEFLNPDVHREANTRAAIYRMHRLDTGVADSVLGVGAR